LGEAKTIYELLDSDRLKRVVEDSNPDVNPELVMALAALCQAEELKRSPPKRPRSESPELPAPSPPPSKAAILITSVHR
jgi:hypothetical protein